MLPTGFTYVEDPRIIIELGYLSHHNFLGRPVASYHALVCILTKEAAAALIAAQDELDALGKGQRLKIFDAYRPKTAVQDFIQWAKDPNSEEMKELFYPELSKKDLFELGYVAEKSSHSRGSTVDLTIVAPNHSNPSTYQELEMGTTIDFFGEQSHIAYHNLSDHAKKNRLFLKNLMEQKGFENYPLEWWHFTLKNEPFPDTYFDFPIL